MFRRKKTTSLVILGLTIGTAMISGSLIMGESMDYMISSKVLKRMNLVDECVCFLNASGEFGFFNYSICTEMKKEISKDNFDGITGEIEIVIPLVNTDKGLGEPSARVLGIEQDSISSFGKFYSNNLEVNASLLNISNSDISDTDNYIPAFITKTLSNRLDAEIGDVLTFIYGEKKVSIVVSSIVDNVGRANWDAGKNVFVDLSTLQRVLILENKINIIKLSNSGGYSGGVLNSNEKYQDAENELKQILKDEKYQPLYIYESKYSALTKAHENAKFFKELFYLFASFSILAAELLIVNIFSLIASERKAELGMARAIGMKRRGIRRICVFEGTCYAFFASLIGTFAGIPISYIMFILMDSFVYSEKILEYYSFSNYSITFSFLIGFLTTIFTIYAVSVHISNLNITRAIRNQSKPQYSILRSNVVKKISIIGTILTILGILILVFFSQHKIVLLFTMGFFFFITCTALLSSTIIGIKKALTFAGLANLIFLYSSISINYEVDMDMFLLVGALGIASFLCIIMPNLRTILNLFSNRKTRNAILTKYSVMHINSYKFRASISIAVFSIVIFTITLLTVVTSSLSAGIEKEAARQSAGYELIGTTSPAMPIYNISDEISSLGLDAHFSSILSFYHSEIFIHTISKSGIYTNISISYPLFGFDADFAYSGKFSLRARDPAFSSDREVFEAMHLNSSLIIIDRTVSHSNLYEYASEFSASIGDILEIVINGYRLQKRIVGILDEFIINGIFLWRDSLELSLNKSLSSSAFLFDVKGNLGIKELEELAHTLERKLMNFGLEILVIEKEVKEIMKLLRRNYALYTAFMGLGLGIGISGLGLIMMREIRERKKEIGILRAIGFKRNQIIVTFGIEASFIIFLGIFIGTLHGINVSAFLWQQKFAPEGFQLVLPLGSIFVINASAFLVSLLGMYLPARTAGSINPSEAIRAID